MRLYIVKYRDLILCRKFFLLFLFGLLFAKMGFAQQDPMPVNAQPYFCSFEEWTENVLWKFDSGSNTSKWSIGNALSNYGDSALYVSTDNGLTAGYDAKAGYVSVYRDFVLGRGSSYEVSFEWINPSQGKMYVCWFDPTLVAGPYSGMSVMALPAFVKNNKKPWSSNDGAVQVLGDTLMNNSGHWQKGSFTVMGTGRTMRLLFFWMNDTGAASNANGLVKHGAGIDNVQIGCVSSCGYLTEVAYDSNGDGTGTLSWKVFSDATGRPVDVTNSILASYDVMYFDGNTWHEHKGIQDPFLVIPGLAAGTYTVWVRINCGWDGNTSNWYILNDLYVHEKIEGCLDYLDINSPTVTATYGTFDDPYLNVGVINDGPGSRSSRLTVHSDLSERDAQTGFELKTIPEGSRASVRLGNWSSGGEAESVTYDYVVDESTVLMLLKYAIVMQDPAHEAKDQPKFKLEILDEDGHLIDRTCGAEDFIAGADNTQDATWHRKGDVQWKDWTGFGLNLQDYVGQNIKIRLTTYDCALQGHYAYAYFTLDCAKAQITGTSCSSGVVQPLMAPEGFTYKWYPKDNPDNIVSETRSFQPGPDDQGIYVCEMSYKGGDCSFQLEASVEPRSIVCDFIPEVSFDSCKAFLQLTNISHTLTGSGEEEECEAFAWELSNGQVSVEKDLKLEFFEPGEHEITLTSFIAGGECFESMTKSVVIPDFGPYVDTLYVNLCEGDPAYECDYNHTLYSKPGIYQVLTEKTACDCDSLVYLNLSVNPVYSDTTEAELFLYKDDFYEFNGKQLTESGVYCDTLSTVTGCDSVVMLKLTAYPRLDVNLLQDSLLLCGDELMQVALEYEIHSGTFSDYSLIFDEKSHAAGWTDQDAQAISGDNVIELSVPADIRPDVYHADLICKDEYSGVDTLPVRIVVYYPSAIIAQKWNDVLALYNENYNGGYVFDSYQWYKDGEPLPGETSSYLYVPMGLDVEAEYQVLLTRSDDQVAIFSCPIIPEERESLSVYPTIVNQGSVLTVSTPEPADVLVQNVTGVRVNSLRVSAGRTDMTSPDVVGTYFVTVKLSAGETRTFTVMVK